MKKPQSLQKMLGHLACWIRLTAHLPLFNVGFTDFTVSMLVWWFYCSLPLKCIEITRFEDDKIKNLQQKACWKCDLEQSVETHKRQQNEVFQTYRVVGNVTWKNSWNMYNTVKKRLRCQVTENYSNKSKSADGVLKFCQEEIKSKIARK